VVSKLSLWEGTKGSWFRRKAVSLRLSTMRYKLVSSANSLISALISFTISFIKVINKRGAISAFDRVWHKGLIHKLKQSGISGNLL
jgi:hypothetical protein